MRTWWPPAFQSQGIRGAYRKGLYSFHPCPSPRQRRRPGPPFSPLPTASVSGRPWAPPPPVWVLPGGKTHAGQGTPDIFPQKTQKNQACFVTERENGKSYPPYGGIGQKERGRKSEITQHRERETGGTHHMGASQGRKRGCCRWRSERKKPRAKSRSRRP